MSDEKIVAPEQRRGLFAPPHPFDLQHMPFDVQEFPIGVDAGNNKLFLTECPFCHTTGYNAPLLGGGSVRVFAFRDARSAREYTISGLCQKCQDETFKQGEADDE